ncbi:RHS repeat-associated core domain-containing protein [Fibrobacter sp. UWCM]|nr:RHS repeat-associated core domain-containing protein [Fibrobacter sp. UWCM]
MLCVSLQGKNSKFQEEPSDLEMQLLELGFLCENVADPDALLEPETFTTVTAYDALNRATSIRTPHNADIPASEILPAYNEASLLESVNVKLRGAATATNFVSDIDYDARGRRERIQYGNGSTTGYTYDGKTFRLVRLLTTRNNGADILQDLNYTYDAVGNVTQIDDNAQQTIFFNGSVVSPSQKFEYDALYRLVKATGREHVSVNADSEPEAEGYNAAQISPQDGTAMRNYAREWEYDSVGNILSMIHKFNGSQWTRRNAYATDSNRLTGTTVGQTTANFTYNSHGSMASMPHLSAMDWDFAEKLRHITRGTTEAYYNYDGNGIRTRKVVVKNGVTETRLYLGGFEIWRKSVNGMLEAERETLHVMDDRKRIAIVETLTVENAVAVAAPVPVQRYQLDNHLGSVSLELDGSANVISYEEYYPYGDTSYRAGRNASEVSQKRYRYTGKEKDEESSLYYCEQRYYAAHVSRWVSTDPTWLEDGINLYAYVNGNPVSGVDPSGTQTENNEATVSDEYNDDKAKEKLISEIRTHVLPELGDEGRKKVELDHAGV